jgi:hypothetical protein
MRYIVLAAALAAGPSLAQEMHYAGDGLHIRLMLADCDIPPIASALKQESMTPPKMAVIKSGDVEVSGCWGTHEDKVLLADVWGRAGFIPMSAFKPSPGI